MPPPRKPAVVNPLRNRPSISAPTAFQKRAATPRVTKRGCPNPQCQAPDIIDGTCHGCGRVVEEFTIVAEVQFGENSSGAAVVQGSFVGADQGTARTQGPGFARMGGSEGRDVTIADGGRMIRTMAAQLPTAVAPHVLDSAAQIFKIAAMNNFIQGRRMDMVAAVCLYSSMRKVKPCTVMLIDFADLCQVNVFKLGHTFKSLHSTITMSKDGIMPLVPEELMHRFAQKLEFGTLVDKVADDACRMLQRMSFDWMVMGRRPSGVCGACLILAARMNNFRRTITEVVYVVKVTTATIQKRLDEFKLTSSSSLTIEEFLNSEWNNQTALDPPSFYQKTEEYQKTLKKRKRRKYIGPIEEAGEALDEEDEGEKENAEEGSGSSDETSPKKRRKTTKSKATMAQPVVELRRDADGFAIPPLPGQPDKPLDKPPHTPEIPIDPDLMTQDQESQYFNQLVDDFGAEFDRDHSVVEDEEDEEEDEDENGEEAGPSVQPRRRKKGPNNDPIHVPDEWQRDEEVLEREISEMISDPNTEVHANSYAQAAKRAAAHMVFAEQNNPQKDVSMDVHVGEDEFADDPEVLNCLLPPDLVAAKEKVWVNNNRDWLRKQQVKEYQRLMAEKGPPKTTRNRKKKPRIGEGQTSAASSPAEAAENLMKARSFSKKIDYDVLKKMLGEGPGGRSGPGSAATSVTSRAGSEAPSDISEADSVRSILKGGISKRSRNRTSTSSKAPASIKSPLTDAPDNDDEDDVDSDDSDYIRPDTRVSKPATPAAADAEDEDDWKKNLKSMDKTGEDGEDDFEDEEDYGFENGDVDDTGGDFDTFDQDEDDY